MRKIILVLMVVAFMFVAGCNQGGDSTKTTETPTFYGGTQGVVAEFEQMGMEVDGIETVWVGTDFPVEVIVKNKGEENIDAQDLTVTIQGVDTTLFNIDNPVQQNTVVLDKVSELNDKGGEETLSFGNAKLNEISSLFYDANFFASVVYKYKTYAAVPKVCFKANYQDDSVCELEGDKKVYSSGAPIVVTSVTQKPSGTKRIAIEFDIENVGGGDVTTPNGEFNSLYNQLNFNLTEGQSDITFTCTSAANPTTARFDQDEKTKVICKSSELPEGTLYTKQLTLELSYKYKDLISRTVRIKNEPN